MSWPLRPALYLANHQRCANAARLTPFATPRASRVSDLRRRPLATSTISRAKEEADDVPPQIPKPPKGTDSSTSALEYKISHPHHKPPRLPSIDPPKWSAEEAVTNILYNTPPPSTQPFTRHVLNCLVQNEPGVLSRVSGILAARGFNIDSLVVCATEITDLSRMCIVLRGQDGVIEQARRQLEDLVPVWAVLDYTHTRMIERELLLCKVSILGPEYFEEQLAHNMEANRMSSAEYYAHEHLEQPPESEEGTPAKAAASSTTEAAVNTHPAAAAGAHHPRSLSPSEALRQKHTHLASIQKLASIFQGAVVDVSNDSVTVQVVGKASRIDAFLKLVRPFGILEAARSGSMVMPRSHIESAWTGMTDDEPIELQEAIDAGLLPPG